MSLLEVKDLVVEFKTDKGIARAINGVSFSIEEGETVGLVGESGSGKSVSALSVLGLVPSPPGKIMSGSIKLSGRDLIGLPESEYRKIRGSEISMIFQEPMTALNPVFKVGTQMVDVLCQHQKLSRSQAKEKCIEMLRSVRIPSPEKRINEYPHQLSGGMRQRVMIGMALSCGPKLLLADEPTTALDVTTQAQVLDEINQLKSELNMAMLLITHDMGVVAETCDRVIVMYCGQIIESGTVKEIFERPKHPYTRGLLDSIPVVREKKLSKLPTIEGVVPDLTALPDGCRFADRCHQSSEKCLVEIPVFHDGVACFNPYDSLRGVQ